MANEIDENNSNNTNSADNVAIDFASVVSIGVNDAISSFKSAAETRSSIGSYVLQDLHITGMDDSNKGIVPPQETPRRAGLEYDTKSGLNDRVIDYKGPTRAELSAEDLSAKGAPVNKLDRDDFLHPPIRYINAPQEEPRRAGIENSGSRLDRPSFNTDGGNKRTPLSPADWSPKGSVPNKIDDSRITLPPKRY